MKIITLNSDFNEVLRFMGDNVFLAYDIETTGLDTHTDKIMGIGLSNADTGYYLALKNYSNGQLEDVLDQAEVIQLLEKLKLNKLYMQNGSFDCRFTLRQLGVDLSECLYSDSMLAKHTVEEESFYSLKEMAKDLYGEDALEEQTAMKNSIKANGGSAKEFYKADLELLGKYCIKDCILTYKINEHYLAKINEEGLTKFFLEDEVMPLYREVTIPMEYGGIPVDLPKLKEYKTKIRQDLINLENKIHELIEPHLGKFNDWFYNYHYPVSRTGQFPQQLAEFYNIDLPRTPAGKFSFTAKNLEIVEHIEFRAFMFANLHPDKSIIRQVQRTLHTEERCLNLSSKHHLKKIFFEELKETPVSFTDKGNPQVDEKFLESVKHKYEFVRLLIDYNKLTKIEGAYIDRFLEEQKDGMFYPSFQQHRTTSGRYGSDLQQLPRPLSTEDEPSELVRFYNGAIREFFIAGDGYKFLDADYNSLEVVVFADDAGDEQLLDVIRRDLDFYSMVAIEVNGLSEYSADKKASNFLKKHKPEIRQATKEYALGARYGLESWKLHKILNISQNEAQKILNNYFNKFKGLKSQMDFYEKQAKTKGFVQSKAGRKRHLTRVKELYDKYGDDLADSLELWKKYHEFPAQYIRMKELRREYNNLINNAFNFPIQSFAASIVNQSSIKIARYLKSKNTQAYICLNVHDQVVVRCATQSCEQVKIDMQQIMENTIKLKAPLIAEPKIANNLKESH